MSALLFLLRQTKSVLENKTFCCRAACCIRTNSGEEAVRLTERKTFKQPCDQKLNQSVIGLICFTDTEIQHERKSQIKYFYEVERKSSGIFVTSHNYNLKTCTVKI